MAKLSPLVMDAVKGAIHHAWLQVLYRQDKFEEIMIMRGLARLRLKRDYGINVNQLRTRALKEIESGKYQEALESTAPYSKGTQRVVLEVAKLIGMTEEELEKEA